jgi:hypothetical protein
MTTEHDFQTSVITKRHAERHAAPEKRHAGVMRTSQFDSFSQMTH